MWQGVICNEKLEIMQDLGKIKNKFFSGTVVAHWETEAGGLLSTRIDWSTE